MVSRSFWAVLYSTALLQPLLRPRIALGKAIQPQDQLLQHFIVLPGGVAVRKFQEILLPFLVSFLQHVSQHILLQEPQFSILSHTERRIQIHLLKIVAHHLAAETVDGHNGGTVNERQLPQQMAVTRMLSMCVLQRLPDTLPHLIGSRPGEGYHQKLVDICRILRIHDQR